MWLVERMRLLSQVFAIDVCANAIIEVDSNGWTHELIS